MAQADKVSKRSVDYKKGTAKERCALCTMYRNTIPDPTCTAVRGIIAPQMWCTLFERK